MRLIDPYVVQYAEHAKLENLFHSSPKQLQELQRQRLAVAWRRRKLKACPLLLHAIHYYWSFLRVTAFYCSTSSLGTWQRDDRLAPNTWVGPESVFRQDLWFRLWLGNSDNITQCGQDLRNISKSRFYCPHLQFSSHAIHYVRSFVLLSSSVRCPACFCLRLSIVWK